jgi:hypothetical protein
MNPSHAAAPLSDFDKQMDLAAAFPAMTLKAAQAIARVHGHTIRRDPDCPALFEVFTKGNGSDAVLASSIGEAVFMATARAMDERGRLFSGQPSLVGMARAICNAIGFNYGLTFDVRHFEDSRVTVLIEGDNVTAVHTVDLLDIAAQSGGVSLQDCAGLMAARLTYFAQDHAAKAAKAAATQSAESLPSGPFCLVCGESFMPDAGGSPNCQDCNAMADKRARRADPMPQVAATAARVIDLTPTWEGMAGALFAILESGTIEGQETARAEIRRALAALDGHNAAAKTAKRNAGDGIAGINVRFFAQTYGDSGRHIVETDESTFASLGGRVTYERHSVFANGCRQICLTTDSAIED